ncbi:MAG: type II toxin-antitoxin system VapC family toxin [Nanoarchaeota archaeon]
MSKLIYCDTNVYMDHFLGRSDRFAPLDEFAAQVFRRSLECEFTIIVSDWVLAELAAHGMSSHMARWLERFHARKKVVLVTADENDKTAARRLPIHFSDAVHAVLAHRHGAQNIVTNNIKDFLPFTNTVPCVAPRFL